MSSLQQFCTDRFINAAWQLYPSTTMIPTAMDHNMCILDEPITHHLNVPRDDNTSSVLNQHALLMDLQKHDDGQLFQSSKQAFSLPFVLSG